MLDVWAMAPYRPGGRTADENMPVLNLFDEAGYTGVVATNVTQDYDRYLRIGDVVTSTPTVADVSEPPLALSEAPLGIPASRRGLVVPL